MLTTAGFDTYGNHYIVRINSQRYDFTSGDIQRVFVANDKVHIIAKWHYPQYTLDFPQCGDGCFFDDTDYPEPLVLHTMYDAAGKFIRVVVNNEY